MERTEVRQHRPILMLLGIVIVVLLAVAAGLIVSGRLSTGSLSGEAGTPSPGVAEAPRYSDGTVAGGAEGAPQALPPDASGSGAKDAGQETSGPSADGDRKVIRSGSMDVRVEKIEPAVDTVRSEAARLGADIASLQLFAGADGGVTPLPLAERSGDYLYPASATIVLRVPAAKLSALERAMSELGDVTGQSASTDDVTEQHVDLSARLRTARAEEERLRGFFDRAEKVSELLAVERELARVRADIEAMDAQLKSLDRQVARATLTVNLTEPGPVVRPEGTNWGIVDAITRGVQAAAALISTFITGIIAILPLLAATGLVWWIVRSWRRRASGRVAQRSAGRDEDQ